MSSILDTFKTSNDTKSKSILDKFITTDPSNNPQSVLSDINISEFKPYIDRVRVEEGFENLRRERAENQSGGEQAIRTLGNLIPNVGLGIIENAGYLLELPNALLTNRKDFSNDLTEFAKEYTNPFGEVYRENPNEVFDINDPAWWYQHGGGLVESIGEFLVTGAGVGKATGSVASSIAKKIGTKTAQRIGQGSANVLTSGSLAYVEGAMSGSEIYKQTFDNYLIENPQDIEGANKLASQAAAKTVKLNTSINTFLNLTGIAPLFSKNSGKLANALPKRQVGEQSSSYLGRLYGSLDELKIKNPSIKDGLLREVIQEGLEEQVNLAAEVSGKLEGGLISEEEAGGDNFIDIFSKQAGTEEGILNFILGSVGGAGQTVGINAISRKNRLSQADNQHKLQTSQINSAITAIESISNYQKELRIATQEGDFKKQEDLKQKINNVLNTEHVRRGTHEALIGTYQEISNVDNTKDLGEQLQPQRDQLFSEIQELQNQENPDQQLILQKSQELDQLVELQNSLFGKTEAIEQGLAKNKDDNDYKTIAQEKITEVKNLENKYREFQNKFNYTEEAELANVAEEVLRRYSNKNIINKNLQNSNSLLSEAKINLSNQINPDQTSSFFLQGEKKAIEALKEKYISYDLRKDKDKSKWFETFNTTDNKKIRSLINDRVKFLDKKLKEVNESLNLVEDKVSEDLSSLISDNYIENIDLQMLNKEANEDFNSITESKKARDEFIESFNNDVKKLVDQKNQKIQEEQEILNQQNKQIKDYAKKYSNLSNQFLSNEELNEFNNLINKELLDQSELNILENLTRKIQNGKSNQDSSSESDKGKRDKKTSTEKQQQDQDSDGEIIDIFQKTEEVEDELNIIEPYTEDRNYEKNPLKNVEIESSDEFEDSLKPFNSGFIITDLGSKPFNKDGNTSNLLNEIYPKKLMTNLINLGDEIIIEVDKNATSLEYQEGGTAKVFEVGDEIVEVNLYEKYKNDINNIPLKVIHNGDFIGYIRVQDSINESTTVDENPIFNTDKNISLQKEINLRLRQYILNNNGKITTTINELGGNSVISKEKDNTIRVLSEVFNNPEIEIGIVTPVGVNVGNSIKVVSNNSKFFADYESRPAIIVPNRDSLLALPVSLNTISENHSNIFSDILETYITNGERNNQLVELIANKTGLNITIKSELEEYLNSFIFTQSISPQESKKLSLIEDKTDKRYLTVGDKEIYIQRVGEPRIVLNSKNLDKFNKEVLSLHIQNMFYNIKHTSLDTKVYIPFKEKDGYSLEESNYSNHLKSVIKTNIYENSFEFKNKQYYSYFDNPKYYFELPFSIDDLIEKYSVKNKQIEKQKPIKKEIKKDKGERLKKTSTEIPTEEVKSKVNKDGSKNTTETEGKTNETEIEKEESTPTSSEDGDLDSKKADIERKRKEELKEAEEKWALNVDEKGFPKEALPPIKEKINFKYDSELASLENEEISESKLIEDISKIPSSFRTPRAIRNKKKNKSNDDELLSSPLESKDKELFSILKEKLTKNYNISIDFYNDIVDKFYIDLLYEVYSGEKQIKKIVKEGFLLDREELKNQEKETRQNLGSYIYDTIYNNLDEYIDLAIDKLNFILDDSLIIEDNIDIESLEDVNVLEKTKFNDDWSFSIDNKSMSSSIVKHFLSIVPDKDIYGNDKVRVFQKYIPFDVVYNTLKSILADSESDFDKMLQILKDNSTELTWLKSIIDNFENPPYYLESVDMQQLKNQFVSLMSNAQYDFRNIIYKKTKTGYESFIISSDRSANFRIILNNWNEKIKESDLVDKTSEIFILDKEKINNIKEKYSKDNLKSFVSKNNSKEDVKNYLNEFFSSIGINLGENALSYITSKKILDVEYSQILTSPSSVFNKVRRKVLEITDEQLLDFQQQNPLFSNSAVEELAKIEAKTNQEIYASSFLNIEGNNISSINLQRNINRRFQDLKNKSFTDLLLKIPFNKHSHSETWLRKLNSENKNFNDIFKIQVLDGITERNSFSEGVKSSSFSPRQLEATKMMAFNKSNDSKVGDFIHFVPSKNVTYMFKAPKLQVSYLNNNLDDKTIDVLYSIAKSEIERINSNINYYGKKGKNFLLFNTLNKLDIFDSKGDILETDDTINLIKQELKNQIDLMIGKKKEEWANLEILKDDKLEFLSSNTDTNKFLASYIVNQIWFQYNMIQSFIGDPAQYSNKQAGIDKIWKDMFKRMTKDITPSLEIPLDKENPNYIQVSLKDREVDSEFIKQFDNITSTDAQEYTTGQEHLHILKQLGRIDTEIYNNLLNKIDNEITLSKEDKAFFQPLKPVARGKRIIYQNAYPITEVTSYVKSSSIPLIKDITEGFEIDKLRIALEEFQAKEGMFVRASYNTANKVGLASNSLEIFDNEGNIKDNLVLKLDTNGEGNAVILLRRDFGIQQEQPKKENEVVDGTQQRKIILSALSLMEKSKAKKISEEYNSTYKKIFEDNYNQLKKELYDDNVLNIDKFSSMLIKEAKERKWSKNDIKALEIVGESFRFPLYLNNSSSRIENLLTSIVNNRIIRTKRQGKALALVSQEGFKGFNPNMIFSENFDGELKPQRKEGDKILPAQVFVPRSLFGKLPTKKVDGRKIIDFDKIDSELFKALGYRIPTQTFNNSMASLEIVGFLPVGFEDMIITPREFVAQMGSDFDIDKLNVFTYEIETSEEEKIIKSISDNNILLDLELEILNDENSFNKINEKLSSKNIEDWIENNSQKEDQTISKIFDSNYSNKYNEAKDGSVGIGKFATLGTFISLASNTENPLSYKEIDKLLLPNIRISNTDISYPFSRTGRLKIDISSQFLNAALDNESNPLLGQINANKFTFNVIQSLITIGYEESDILNFINQPIIKNYVNQLQLVSETNIMKKSEVKEVAFNNVNNNLSTEQINNLEIFRNLEIVGDSLQDIKNIIGIDSNGIPKDLIDVQDKLDAFDTLYQNPIENLDNLLQNNIIEFSYQNALVKTQDIWKQLNFPYETKYVRTSFNKISDLSSINLTSNQKKEIYKELKSFIYSEASKILVSNNLYKERERLLIGDNSLVNRILKLQEENVQNLFIKALKIPDLGDNIKDGRYIKFNNAALQGVNEEYLYEAFNELLLDSRYYEVGKDLILYTYLTNSNITPTNFIKFIPLEYLEASKFINGLKRFNFEQEVDDRFIYQFFRNNPKFASRINIESNDINNKIINSEGFISRFESENYPDIVSYYDQENKIWRLYFRKKDTELYNLVDLLGDNRKGNQIKEYDSDNLYNKSVFEKNNVSGIFNNINYEERQNLKEYVVNPKEGKQAFLSKYNTEDYKSFINSLLEKAKLTSNQKLLLQLLKGITGESASLEFFYNEDLTGKYDPINHIIKLPNNLLNEKSLIDIFIEEGLHSITAKTILDYKKSPKSLDENKKKFVSQLDGLRVNYFEKLKSEKSKIYDRFKEQILNKSGFDEETRLFYRVSSLEEFVIGIFDNEQIKNDLNNKIFEGEKTLLQRLIEVFNNFLTSFKRNNNVKTGTELDIALNSIFGIIQNNNITEDIFTETKDLSSPQLVSSNEEFIESLNDQIENEKFDRNLIDKKGNPIIFNYNQVTNKWLELQFDLQGYNSIPVIKENNEGYYIDLIENISGQLFSSPKQNSKEANFINEIQKDINFVKNNIRDVEGNDQLKIRLQKELEKLEDQKNRLIENGSLITISEIGEEQLNDIIKLLDKGNLTAEELRLSINIISLYTRLDNYLLDKSRLSDPEYRNSANIIKLIELKRQAEELEERWIPIARDYVKQLGEEVGIYKTENELFGYNHTYGLGVEKDVTKATSLTLDASRTGSPLIGVIDKLIKYNIVLSEKENDSEWSEIDEKINNFQKSNFFKKYKYEKFQQKFNGKLTGNLINRTSQEYFEKIKELSSKLNYLKEINADKKAINKARKEFFDFKKENEIQINVNRLFKEDKEGNIIYVENKSYLRELENLLGGENRVSDAIESAKKKIISYEKELKAKLEQIDSLEYDNETDKLRELNKWKAQNDPFTYFNNIERGIDKQEGIYFNNYKSIYSEPNKKWHDPDFDFIDNYKETIDGKEIYIAKDFYKWYINKLHDYYRLAPDLVYEELQYNYLPILRSSLVDELFSDKGIGTKATTVLTKVLDSLSERPIQTSQDRRSGRTDLELQFPFQEKEFITEGQKQREIDRSTRDLQEILKIVSKKVLFYKYVKQIEDKVKVAQTVFDFQDQITKKKNGDEIYVNASQGALHNKKLQLDYTITSNLYGLNPSDEKTNWVLISAEKMKTLNPETKKILQELEEEIKLLDKSNLSKSEFSIKKKQIDKKIESLGDPITSRKAARAFANYVQIKGMGFNVLSAVNNFLFAWISNATHAAGEEDFSNTEFKKATTKMLHSTSNLLPGIAIGTALGSIVLPGFGTIMGAGLGALISGDTQRTKESKKIGSLMKLYNVLGDIIEVDDFKRNHNTNERKWYERFGAYELQRKSEYFSYGTTMVSMMLKKKIKTEKQGEVSLYEIYNEKGKINTEKYGKVEFDNDSYVDFKLKLDQVNKLVHGNYDKKSPILIKKSVIGQMLMQFRSWLPESLSQRFDTEKEDFILERERSGRWSFIWGREDRFSLLGQMFMRVAFLQKNTFYDNKDLKKHEIANLKKNIAELRFIGSILILALMLKGMDDEDDEDTIGKYATNFALNAMFRLNNDLLFYASPLALENMSNNLVPALSIIPQGYKTFNYAFKVLFDEEADEQTKEALLNNSLRLVNTGILNVKKAQEQIF